MSVGPVPTGLIESVLCASIEHTMLVHHKLKKMEFACTLKQDDNLERQIKNKISRTKQNKEQQIKNIQKWVFFAL